MNNDRDALSNEEDFLQEESTAKGDSSHRSYGTRHKVRKIVRVIQKPPVRFTLGCAALFLGAFSLWITWHWVNEPTFSSRPIPAPPSIAIHLEEPPVSREEISRLFESDLMPLIEYAHNENTDSKDRAIQTFRDHFSEFHDGIPAFTEDLTGWGTRFGIVSNWTKDKWDVWWNENENANRLGEYVHAKFREHILSEEKLEAAFTDSIEQYTADIIANRNALLSEMKIVLSSQQLPVQVRVPKEEFDNFAAQTQQHFLILAQDLGEKSLESGIVSFVAGETVAWGATQVTMVVFRSLVPAVSASLTQTIISGIMTPVAMGVASHFAVRGLAAGGATALFAAGGGAGGTTAGPIGTGVGIVIGLVLGSVTDWWMSARFEEKTASEISAMLDVMEAQIIGGVQNEAGATFGLEGTFSEANRQMMRLMRQATLEAMWERVSG